MWWWMDGVIPSKAFASSTSWFLFNHSIFVHSKSKPLPECWMWSWWPVSLDPGAVGWTNQFIASLKTSCLPMWFCGKILGIGSVLPQILLHGNMKWWQDSPLEFCKCEHFPNVTVAGFEQLFQDRALSHMMPMHWRIHIVPRQSFVRGHRISSQHFCNREVDWQQQHWTDLDGKKNLHDER